MVNKDDQKTDEQYVQVREELERWTIRVEVLLYM